MLYCFYLYVKDKVEKKEKAAVDIVFFRCV